MTVFSVYSNGPGDLALQHTWDEYKAHPKTVKDI